MPRIPGVEGKKKEPPAYTGDPYATQTSIVYKRDRAQSTQEAHGSGHV